MFYDILAFKVFGKMFYFGFSLYQVLLDFCVLGHIRLLISLSLFFRRNISTLLKAPAATCTYWAPSKAVNPSFKPQRTTTTQPKKHRP